MADHKLGLEDIEIHSFVTGLHPNANIANNIGGNTDNPISQNCAQTDGALCTHIYPDPVCFHAHTDHPTDCYIFGPQATCGADCTKNNNTCANTCQTCNQNTCAFVCVKDPGDTIVGNGNTIISPTCGQSCPLLICAKPDTLNGDTIAGNGNTIFNVSCNGGHTCVAPLC